MENFADLMQRLLELQSGGKERSPELIAEERAIDGRFEKSGREISANSKTWPRLPIASSRPGQNP
jgi:hypothetical protein